MEVRAGLIWDMGCLLGEGPAWFAEEAALRFVDIKRGRLHRFDPVADLRETIEVGGNPSFILPAEGGRVLVGSGNSIRLLQDDRLGSSVAEVRMAPHNRTNDATVNSAGRLWFGTMDDDERQPTGAIYMFDGNSVQEAGGACIITNGPATSPDGHILYRVDTLGRRVWRHDISASPQLGKGTIFVEIDEADGTPDGITLDSEGCLWVGLWGGWEARRYASDGTLMARVRLPCANVTKVAFGGPDLRTGYVTTARAGLSDRAWQDQPLAGGLFAFEAPAPGLRLADVRLPL